MTYPIHLIVGQAGSGKDTVAQMLKDSTNACQIISFAEPIKQFVGRVFEVEDAKLYGKSEFREGFITSTKQAQRSNFFQTATFDWIKDVVGDKSDDAMVPLENWFKSCQGLDGGLTIRHALQTLGTEWGRTIEPEIWVNYGIKRAKKLLVEGVNAVVISDGRFRNEILAVKALGGNVIQVINGNQPTWVATNAHKSESEQTNIPSYWYDYRVVNFFEGLDVLRQQVNKLAMKLKLGPE
jgi:hypothetical protein